MVKAGSITPVTGAVSLTPVVLGGVGLGGVTPAGSETGALVAGVVASGTGTVVVSTGVGACGVATASVTNVGGSVEAGVEASVFLDLASSIAGIPTRGNTFMLKRNDGRVKQIS
jgi:hypothetical protein